jgi:hypothetical protein
MAHRTRTKKVESSDIQGEGSYIALRLPTRGEVKALYREGRALQRATERAGELEEAGQQEEADQLLDETMTKNDARSAELVIQHLVEWNWSGDDGKQLDRPKSIEDIDALTSAEADFLINAVTELYQPTPEQQKN